jgi:hypothetical protein
MMRSLWPISATRREAVHVVAGLADRNVPVELVVDQVGLRARAVVRRLRARSGPVTPSAISSSGQHAGLVHALEEDRFDGSRSSKSS